MKKSTFLLPFCFALSLFTFTACTEEENSLKVSCGTSQEDVLLSYANQFSTDIVNCLEAFTTLETVNWNSTSESEISGNKDVLKEARIAYNAISSYNFGPAVVDGVDLNDRFNIFPTNETAIATSALSGEQDIESLFKSQVGLEAIEYIVYNINSIAGNESERAAVIQHLEAQISAARLRITALNSVYSSDGYIDEFKSNTGSDDGSSLALFTNQFVQDIEARLRNNKLRIPFGKFNGGIPLLDKIEGRYSDFGLEYASKHFNKIKNLFGTTSDSLSLAAYLSCLGETDLAQSIESQLEITSFAYSDLQSTNGSSIVNAIENDNANVSALIDEHQKLVALLKGPMLSALGVRINYTDSDGD